MSIVGRAHDLFAGILSLVRIRPFNTLTAEGRAQERLRRVLWSATASGSAKAINTVTVLLSVPITLAYLGSERYGLWMTVTALTAVLGFADLGIGNVVVNLVAQSHGKDNVGEAEACVSSALFSLTVFSALLGLLFFIVSPRINWSAFFNVSSQQAMAEAGPAVATFVACFLVNLPLSAIPRIQMGYQEGYIVSIWQAIGNTLGLIGLVVVVHMRAGLPWLILVVSGAPILANVLNGIVLFARQRPWLAPRWRALSVALSRQILSTGFLFLLLQIGNAFLYSFDNIIVTRVLSPEAVTQYAVPSRLFTVVPMMLYMFLAPLWPAYGEARARGDNAWLKTTLRKAMATSFLFCFVSSLFLLVFGKRILNLWVGAQVAFSWPLMSGLGVWTIISSIVTAMALFLNAIDKIGFQVIFTALAATLSVLVRVALAKSTGLPGVIWGGTVVLVLCMMVPYTVYLTRWFATQAKLATSIQEQQSKGSDGGTRAQIANVRAAKPSAEAG